MSFEAQGRYGLFTATAKAQFSESTNYNSTSTFLVARCIVRNPLIRGKDFRVNESAKALLDSNQFDDFTKAFGDSFVRGLQTGGEFYAVIRITSISTTKQNELATLLQAEYNGLAASGEFKTKFAQANANTSTKSEYTATMYQKAGSGSAETSPTVEISEVISRFKDFPDIAKNSPFAYETEVATYDTLPLPIPTLEEQEDFLFVLRDARDKKLFYIQTRNDLEFAQRHPIFFEGLPTNDILSNAIDIYTELINEVMEHAIKLSRGQINPPRFFDPSVLSPPIDVPEPISLRRVTPSPLLTIQVRDLTGYDLDAIEETIQNASSGSLPTGVSQEDADFIRSNVRFKYEFVDDDNQQDFLYWSLKTQIPSNRLVAPGSEIILIFEKFPDDPWR